MRCHRILAALVTVSCALSNARADEVRTYEENGITYRETRRTVRRPTWETQWQDQQRTVYREQLSAESRDSYRTVLTPITEYQWEPVWQNRWNPLVQPHVEYRMVPRTRWESRTEVVRVPVTRRELVPETQVERVPITSMKMVDEEITSRIAIGGNPSPASSGASVARRDAIGGEKLQGDPPRQGTVLRNIEPIRK